MPEFKEYNGWINKPTWSMALVLGSYFETQEEVESLVNCKGDSLDASIENLQDFLRGNMGTWYIGMRNAHTEAIDNLMKDLVGASVYYVDWVKVRDALNAEQETVEGDDITQAAFTLLRSGNWLSAIKPTSKYEVQKDDDVRDFVVDMIYNWIEIPSMRLRQGPVLTYIKTAFNIWMRVINWADVVNHFKAEPEEAPALPEGQPKLEEGETDGDQ